MKKVWVVWINFAPYSDPPKFVRAFTNEADATKFCIEHTQTLSPITSILILNKSRS